MGTGKCTEVLVLLPPSSANNAAPKFVRCQRITKAGANAADVTRDEGHAVRVGVRHILYGGHWRLRRTFNGRGRPVEGGGGGGGEYKRGSCIHDYALWEKGIGQHLESRPVVRVRRGGDASSRVRLLMCERVAKGTAHEQTGMQQRGFKIAGGELAMQR